MRQLGMPPTFCRHMRTPLRGLNYRLYNTTWPHPIHRH
jgi:hypothetical protein